MIVQTPTPPYYAVIFSSVRSGVGTDYDSTADQMMALAAQQAGFLGVESARQILGITVSYWESLEAIQNWRLNAEHALAREQGRARWYASFSVRICRVERAYTFEKE